MDFQCFREEVRNMPAKTLVVITPWTKITSLASTIKLLAEVDPTIYRHADHTEVSIIFHLIPNKVVTFSGSEVDACKPNKDRRSSACKSHFPPRVVRYDIHSYVLCIQGSQWWERCPGIWMVVELTILE